MRGLGNRILEFNLNILVNYTLEYHFFSNLREKKKKERESMSEADFLEHKRNFETKMGVPTTPHKKELKNKFLAIIEYA